MARDRRMETDDELELDAEDSVHSSVMDRIERISGEEMPDCGRIATLLRVESEQEIERRGLEWAGLNAVLLGLIERIAAEEMPEQARLGELLRAESIREIEGRAGDWSAMQAKIFTRIESAGAEEIRLEASIGAALVLSVESELSRREGDWTAFHAQLDLRLRDQAIQENRLSLEDRVFSVTREAVRVELDAVEPRFETNFMAQLLKRLDPPTGAHSRVPEGNLWRRFRRWITEPTTAVRQLLCNTFSVHRDRYVFGGAAVSCAVVLLAAIAPPSLDEAAPSNEELVSIDDLSFEGTATVMKSDGNAVIWLADAADDDF